ncbi:acetoacetate--CoA ligase [Enterovirga rhinocerotis]|uniref:Acetoacetyl-CoA synthetase n=1 Tax=Enterovirga rhinocerotis TaxID=1339210 RepID=A0A4V3DZ54_9HYPH|nr:acetoacetate--CoA ligase [Enterovirga rhinocerotis]TDR94679.1 acetoacetyl-CoA synthetase [Enterovirga rhinocerotis]
MRSPSQVEQFIAFCHGRSNAPAGDFEAFERWSVAEFRLFWRDFLDWSAIAWSGSAEPVCVGDLCETARFFPEIELNYADIVLSPDDTDAVAITAARRGRPDEIITRRQLRRRVVRLAAHLERLGIRSGDRVVAIARNRPEAVIAALAAAAIGATFSSCSQEMGAEAILARFSALGAGVLLAHVAAEPWDAGEPLATRVCEVAARLPGLRHLVALDPSPVLDVALPVSSYEEIMAGADDEEIAAPLPRLPFNHPLFILFSSGTTGQPKCIVHGAGGTLLEHLKEHRLHCDLKAGDRLYFHTGCAWMMWNWQLTALASGAEIVLFDGPIEGPGTLWDLVERLGVTVFGTSPTYLQLCERTGYRPGAAHRLDALRSVLSTGSVLYDRQFDWFERHVKPIPLQSISGGTDILGCFVLGLPLRPVTRGEAQSRSLALDVRAIPAREGDAIGELVCANPFPSRPLGFFGDDGSAFHRAYFSQNPPFWTHGDLIAFGPSGGARLHGRSDDVMNIKGIRIGPAEIYAILKRIDGIADSMAVEREHPSEGSDLVLLVVLDEDRKLDAELLRTVRRELAEQGSTAFVPALCVQVPELPETISGKRSETSVRDLVNNRPVRNAAALRNPGSLGTIQARIEEATSARATGPEGAAATATSPEGIRDLIRSELRIELGLDDSFLDAGADSLAIVHILLRLQETSGHALSIDDLLASPSPRGIAALFEGGASAGGGPPTGAEATSIRAARPEDLDEICALLDRGFPGGHVARSEWRRIAATRWTEDDLGYGLVLLAGGQIVGFLGTLFADRPRDDGTTALVCNLTSWYVEPAYRSAGALLMAAAMRRRDVIYTSLTPAPTVEPILSGIGFTPYAHLEFYGPRLKPLTVLFPGIRVNAIPAIVRERIGTRQHRVFDNNQHDSLLHLFVEDRYGDLYLIAKRRKMAWNKISVVVSEVIYADNIELFRRSFDAIANYVLLKQRSVLVSVESRHAPPKSRPLRRSKQSRYIYPGPPEDDRFYGVFSEFSILDV